MALKYSKIKAVVIGETKLCVQCAEILLKNEWEIASVVTEDNTVVTWAKNNSIPILPIAKLNEVKADNFYLFSIINPYIITNSFLKNKKVLLALNYHDSLLPKYAGVNSTTWAILNNEKQHGVTIHKIETGIDEGNIAGQSEVAIDKDETALSLNLKCSETLLSLFKEIVSKIEAGTLKFSKQDLKQRTYYGLKHLPDNYGIINGTKDIDKLQRLIKGLTFGTHYDNPIATVKVWLNNSFYVVEKLNPDIMSKKNELSNDTILFDETKDIYGNKTSLKIKYNDIAKTHALTEDDLKHLATIKVKERDNKNQILKFFAEHSEIATKILEHATEQSNNHSCSKKINISKDVPDTTLVALVCLVLIRFFRDEFIATLYLDDNKNNTISSTLQALIDCRNYIYANKDLLNQSFADLENHVAKLQDNPYIVTKDFNYRYNIPALTDIALMVGETISTDKHRMLIKIQPKNHQIEISGDGACELQINSIAEAINTLLTKDIPNEIANKDLKHLNLLNTDQYQQLVFDWNNTEKNYPHDKTIHQLFEEQVLKTPDNIAIVYKNTKLTYQELNQKANQLANYLLHNHRIKPDELIALYLDRSEYMIIAILGVLKSGGAYVPIDPAYPDQRVSYILDDTNAEVILTNNIYEERLQQIIKQKRKKIIGLDNKETQVELAKQQDVNPTTAITSANLIYVIYTSGTTGNPKGVLIAHCNIANYMNFLIDFMQLNSTSRGSTYAGFGFDAVVAEIYPLLLSGGAIYIVNNEDKNDSIKINEFFNKHGITYAFLPTQIAELFLELHNTSLINLLVAGDKLNKFIRQKYRIINGYGPTEASVHTTRFIVDKPYNNIPIGKPIDNVKCYVVDNNINILPIGAIGELLIGGESLARGYLNQPELTAEKFIPNPFQTKTEKEQNKNSRLYKTGDLARMLPNGNLEYIGRNDFQVKIRGFRIELGEVENKISGYPGVKQAVVITKNRPSRQTNDKYLLAYYVADNKLDEAKIQAYLISQLPEYMIPSIFMYLKKLPLTANGKIDKKALPEPKFTSQSKRIPPRTVLEKYICKIFAQTLGLPVEQIGIKDDFFSMGGDSISSIQLVYQIKQKLALNISVSDVFINRDVEQLVKNVLTNQDIQNNTIDIKQEDNPIGKSNFSPIQEWFFDNIRNGYHKKHNHWNQSFIIKIPEIAPEILKLIIKKLLQHHDAFRFRYKNFENNYIEVDLAKESENIKYINISGLTDTEIKNKLIEIQSNFNIETGPIYVIAYLYGYQDKTARLFFAMHHLIVNSVSWRILTRDISRLYKLLQNPENTKKASWELLEQKGTSYRQWVEEIKNYKSTQELSYWDDILKDYVHIPKSINKESCDEFLLSSQLTQKLLTKANEAYDTQANDILLSALSRTLAQVFDRHINHVTLEGHGREEINPEIDISRTMGWFTIMYPVKLVNQQVISDLIKITKENLKNIPNKGIGYGPIKGYKNLPNIIFNYLGQISNREDIWTITDHIISMDPQNQDSYILNIYGYVVNNALRFHVICNDSLPFNANIFADKFKANLEELIAHCTVNHEITKECRQNINESIQDSEMYAMLDQVKFNYTKKSDGNQADKQLQDKIDLYLKNVNELQQDLFPLKPITNVLLTGSAGFLGCNLLNQLLTLTNYNIFLLVRADSQPSAVDKINKKFQFYFDKTLNDVYGQRVFILKADLTKNNLDLSEVEYKELATKIDTIIHAAALVKHGSSRC